MQKQTVHNQLEGKVLIKESFRNGDEDKYDGCRFFTHDGEFLFTSKVRLTEFEMDLSFNGERKDSIIVFI